MINTFVRKQKLYKYIGDQKFTHHNYYIKLREQNKILDELYNEQLKYRTHSMPFSNNKKKHQVIHMMQKRKYMEKKQICRGFIIELDNNNKFKLKRIKQKQLIKNYNAELSKFYDILGFTCDMIININLSMGLFEHKCRITNGFDPYPLDSIVDIESYKTLIRYHMEEYLLVLKSKKELLYMCDYIDLEKLDDTSCNYLRLHIENTFYYFNIENNINNSNKILLKACMHVRIIVSNYIEEMSKFISKLEDV
jgi:hypothetical protein